MGDKAFWISFAVAFVGLIVWSLVEVHASDQVEAEALHHYCLTMIATAHTHADSVAILTGGEPGVMGPKHPVCAYFVPSGAPTSGAGEP